MDGETIEARIYRLEHELTELREALRRHLLGVVRAIEKQEERKERPVGEK